MVPVPVVYPNPVTGTQVTIALPGYNLSDVTVDVFTLSLRKVLSVHEAQVTGESLVMPLRDKSGVLLANGLYYLRVSVGTRRWTLKMLVLK